MPRLGDRIPLAERFWAKVNKYPAGCWHWVGGKTYGGYGHIGEGGRRCRTILAHRVAWFLEHGEWPDKLVLHSCDNPGCVNPAHLFLGSQSDNMDDCSKKGRRAAKLTPDLVREIRRLYALGDHTHRSLAADFQISQYAIYSIVNGKTWKHA